MDKSNGEGVFSPFAWVLVLPLDLAALVGAALEFLNRQLSLPVPKQIFATKPIFTAI